MLTSLQESHLGALPCFSNLFDGGNKLPYVWVSPDTFNLFALKTGAGRMSGTARLSRVSRQGVMAGLLTMQKSQTRILYTRIPNSVRT